MSGSAAQDWLANMILTVKTIAAGAEFIPVPYIRGAFGTVVILLETVDKMKKNRDDLLDLCESIVEIVRLLQAEVSAHGNVTGVRLMPLCEDFISFLCMLQIQLEKGMRNQVGFRGRFKAFLRATTVADHLVRYRNRINELRSNFLLVATIDTNLNVARIQQSVTPSREIPPIQQFRHVALGEINLLYETAMSSKAHKVKVFTARISGESSLMTVAKYEDELDRWKSDLELYSRLRHPNVWQLFGFAAAPGLHALIYHDELIPLSIYRQFHRPSSDLVWVCIEGMLFHQFRDSSQHHCWSTDAKIEKNLEPTLCVKRKPVQLCLTMPLLGNDSEDDDDEHRLSLWHTRLFKDHNPTADSRAVLNILTASPPDATLSSTLARNIDWKHLFATLIPVRFSREIPWQMRTQLFLGSVIAHRCDGFIPVAYIPNSSCVFIRPWELRVLPTVRPDREINSAFKLNRFTFLPGSFKAKKQPESDILLSCSITLEEDAVNALNMSWLSQANSCISEFSPNVRKSHRCGVVDKLWCALIVDADYRHLLRMEGTLQKAHLFVRSVSMKHHGPRIGLDSAESDHFYWSLDPTGNTQMTPDECDSLGLPRLKFLFLPRARFWHEYHCDAIREFFEAKGFDPESRDVTRLLGLPLAETEPNIPPLPTQDGKVHP